MAFPDMAKAVPAETGDDLREIALAGWLSEEESNPWYSSPQGFAFILEPKFDLTDAEARWLLDEEIPDTALWPIWGANVIFNGKTFDFDEGGKRALIFRALDRGEVIDLIAWQPRSGNLVSWHGRAFCLGDEDALLNPASWFENGAIKVHRSPLEWLRSGRDGIIIVNPRRAFEKLSHCRRLVFADANHAKQVRAWMQPPKLRVQFLIEGRAAA